MARSKQVRTCVIYARISVGSDESVSIERQIESATHYATAHGWKILGEFIDEGVSATKNMPQDRKGWQELLKATGYDAVIIWKVDRLARRVLDFLTANEALEQKGAGIVAVEDPINMTTAQGKAFATMLAVFGEMEAAAISARVTAARDYLLRDGRYPGGRVMFGYRSVPNPDGAGYVLAQDPERIDYVKEMVRRTQAGYTVYSTLQWLQETGVPAPDSDGWLYNAVDRILKHPLLAGMLPHNPGNTGKDGKKERGDDVVRRPDNDQQVIYPELAVMSYLEWKAMQAKLTAPTPQRMPWAQRSKTSPLLSGLIWCADPSHPKPLRMYRGTYGSKGKRRPAYYCKVCYQTMSRPERVVVQTFLDRMGDELYLGPIIEELGQGEEEAAERVAEIKERLAELTVKYDAAPEDEEDDIYASMKRQKKLLREAQKTLDEARQRPQDVRYVFQHPHNEETYREVWEAAESDRERRAILDPLINKVLVRRGTPGRWTLEAQAARCTFEWSSLGTPWTEPTQEEIAEMMPWVEPTSEEMAASNRAEYLARQRNGTGPSGAKGSGAGASRSDV